MRYRIFELREGLTPNTWIPYDGEVPGDREDNFAGDMRPNLWGWIYYSTNHTRAEAANKLSQAMIDSRQDEIRQLQEQIKGLEQLRVGEPSGV